MIPRPHNQDGNALIFVTIVGLVMSMAFALFMTSTTLNEKRAVEAQLAASRTYWAEMGNFHYAMSRISYSALCGNNCGNKVKDTALVPVLQDYFNELSNNKVWTFADESASYSITTITTAATAGGQTYSGWLLATASYATSTLVANSAGSKLPLLELGLCVGLNNSGAKCGNSGNNNGGNTTAYFSVNHLTNLPAP